MNRHMVGLAGLAPALSEENRGLNPASLLIPPQAPKIPKCLDCLKGCKSCAGKRREATKIEWPPYGSLRTMVKQTSYAATARRLGVSDTAVKRRLLRYAPKKPS